MHHKFAVIDGSVVITGSFNWTGQAVKFTGRPGATRSRPGRYENKELAKKYTEEYERLWNSFIVSISKETALKKIEEDETKRKVMMEARKKAREDAKK